MSALPASIPDDAARAADSRSAATGARAVAAAKSGKAATLAASAQVQRVLLPALVGLVLLLVWQALVTGLELPPYLVPSPLLMLQTLMTDWVALGLSLWVTVKITLLAFALATVAGVLISFVFVQSKLIETALFPMPCCCR